MILTTVWELGEKIPTYGRDAHLWTSVRDIDIAHIYNADWTQSFWDIEEDQVQHSFNSMRCYSLTDALRRLS